VSTIERAQSERRPRRRHVRIHCSLVVGGREYSAFTRNVSGVGVYALVREASVDTFEPGQLVRLHLALPDDGSSLDCAAEIAWTDAEDRDIDNAPSVGLGLRLFVDDTQTGRRLQQFVDQFRYAILIAGGAPADRARYHDLLSLEYGVSIATTSSDVFAMLEHREVAVVLVLPDFVEGTALELLDAVHAKYPHLTAARVVLSRTTSVDELRRLINLGGMFRCLSDEMDDTMVLAIVREAVDRYALDAENARIADELARTHQLLERENAFLRQRLTGVEGFDKIIGHSSQLRTALAQLERVRRTDAPVYIHGETGTGKELAARALHAGGPRSARSYIVQNCAGMTETLLQSTLFGHRKGAFTGADRDHRGVFLEADGGTLFLDEVGELSPATQAMLLRALQEGEVTPVGATRPLKVDVRIISATHKDLREEVKAGRFREDLLYRLVVVTVTLPPLRDRHGDIPLLARHFLDLHCEQYGKNIPGIRPEVIAAFEAYAWPGNVRELDNELERMVILADDDQKLGLDSLSPHIAANAPRRGRASTAPPDQMRGVPYDVAVEQLERRLVEGALEAANGSVTKAAEQLGIERSRLGKIRKRLGISD
jgi:two-component system, NtrC family, response regulator HupR/HoxA